MTAQTNELKDVALTSENSAMFVPSSLELGDGAGTSITNLWSVSTPELPFTTNGFGYYYTSYNGGSTTYRAWLRSGSTSTGFARVVTPTGGFGHWYAYPNATYTPNGTALRPAVHITPVQNLTKPTNLIFDVKLGFVTKNPRWGGLSIRVTGGLSGLRQSGLCLGGARPNNR